MLRDKERNLEHGRVLGCECWRGIQVGSNFKSGIQDKFRKVTFEQRLEMRKLSKGFGGGHMLRAGDASVKTLRQKYAWQVRGISGRSQCLS